MNFRKMILIALAVMSLGASAAHAALDELTVQFWQFSMAGPPSSPISTGAFPGTPASGSGTTDDGITYSWTWDGVGEAVLNVSGAIDTSATGGRIGFYPYFVSEPADGPMYASATLTNNGNVSLWSVVGDWNGEYVEDGETFSTAGWTYGFPVTLESGGGGCDFEAGWSTESTGSNLDLTLTIQIGDAAVSGEDWTWGDVKALFR